MPDLQAIATRRTDRASQEVSSELPKIAASLLRATAGQDIVPG
jgi:hypothetical protein